MASPFYMTIQDVSGPRYFAPDVVPQAVMDAFQTQVQVLQAEYQKALTNPGYQYTVADFNTINQARNTLIGYADSGINLGPNLGTGYLNQTMAQTLDTLLKTFDIAGFNTINANLAAGTVNGQAYTTSSSQYATDAVSAVQQWSDLSVAGLGEYIGDALNSVSTGRSIQAMIELEYIKAGNDLITQQLNGLQSALSLTQQATNILTNLQEIQNKVTPDPTSAQAQGVAAGSVTSTTGDTYVTQFQNAGNAAYNQPVPVTTASTLTNADMQLFNSYTTQSGALYQLIVSLLPQFGSSYTVADLGPPPIAALDGTLPQALYTVYYDMTTNAGSSITNWITDHMGEGSDYSSTLAGNYSTDMTTAQTAAQSLNDQQKQNVQQALFLFQEFYQSGSGMLTQINQIIQSMAQAAGQ